VRTCAEVNGATTTIRREASQAPEGVRLGTEKVGGGEKKSRAVRDQGVSRTVALLRKSEKIRISGSRFFGGGGGQDAERYACGLEENFQSLETNEELFVGFRRT